MNPRLRRLLRDEQELRSLSGHPFLEVHAKPESPPQQYIVRYFVPGVTRGAGDSQPELVDAHQLRMILPTDYPRLKPVFQTMTAVFHPNFDDGPGGAVCIADFWTAGIPITDVVLKVGMMLQYQIYNVDSPLNQLAASWVKENEGTGTFPVGTVDLSVAEPDIHLGDSISVRSE